MSHEPDSNKKRKLEEAEESGIISERGEKTHKTKKQWQTPHAKKALSHKRTIEPGDAGIFATCARGKEGKAASELLDLFEEHAKFLYKEHFDHVGDVATANSGAKDNDCSAKPSEGGDIEHEIQEELEAMQKGRNINIASAGPQQAFTHVKLNLQCVLFFQTHPPVEPVAFVRSLCKRILEKPERRTSRFAKRLTPITATSKARTNGIDEIAGVALAPHFHGPEVSSKKFAIRPTFRNHNTLKREDVIRQIAGIVGPRHTVDLTNPDLVVLVEIYQDICGISVVDGGDYDTLKRYNLAEIGGSSASTQ